MILWEEWLCPNGFCTSETWMVRCDRAQHEVWWLAEHMEDSPFMMAATLPICPRCGTTLLIPNTHEARSDEQISVEMAYV